MSIIKKCRSALFYLKTLRQYGSTPSTIWAAYNAFVLSHICYAWPLICDCSAAEAQQLARVEKRAARIAGLTPTVCLTKRLDNICRRLFCRVVKNPQHPLRRFFDERKSHHNTRRSHNLLPPRCKTERFRKCFIRFAS